MSEKEASVVASPVKDEDLNKDTPVSIKMEKVALIKKRRSKKVLV